MSDVPQFQDVLEARERIASVVNPTPVLISSTFNELLGARLFFKAENFQRCGAFKFRGATNAVRALPADDAPRGVATHSSGNHAQALALAAKARGIAAHVVMPVTSPAVKQAAVRGYGAEITLCEPTLDARENTLAGVVSRTGASVVHPFDNFHVIAGQGTAALELLEQQPEIDLLLAPIGGGGLMSGTAITARHVRPKIELYGVEPELAADAKQSLETSTLQRAFPPRSIADGLLTSLSNRTYSILSSNLNGIVTVSEDEIIEAMRLLWERMKIVVEPSGAVPFAAALFRKVPVSGKNVGIILSGGNVDLNTLPWISREIPSP